MHIYNTLCCHWSRRRWLRLSCHVLYNYAYVNTAPGGTVPVERTDSAAARVMELQWYERVNSECRCKEPVKCGDVYRQIVQERRVQLATEPTADHSHYFTQRLAAVRARWRASGSGCHYMKRSATCDLAHMPRELLPLLFTVRDASSGKYPYVPRATVDDVRAITAIRCKESLKRNSSQWQLVQSRLWQYAQSSSGTVAEAIVHNDCCWRGELAYAVPSHKNSKVGARSVKAIFDIKSKLSAKRGGWIN
jgi:hypothetical protein